VAPLQRGTERLPRPEPFRSTRRRTCVSERPGIRALERVRPALPADGKSESAPACLPPHREGSARAAKAASMIARHGPPERVGRAEMSIRGHLIGRLAQPPRVTRRTPHGSGLQPVTRLAARTGAGACGGVSGAPYLARPRLPLTLSAARGLSAVIDRLRTPLELQPARRTTPETFERPHEHGMTGREPPEPCGIGAPVRRLRRCGKGVVPNCSESCGEIT